MTWNGSKSVLYTTSTFILLDKTRIWFGMARKVFSIPYSRFILLDKTRIWLGKHVSQEFMISVRPSATHPSVRPLLIRPYPRFILTRRHAEGTAQRNMLLIMLSDPPLHADRLIANQEYKHMQMRVHQGSRTIWYCE